MRKHNVYIYDKNVLINWSLEFEILNLEIEEWVLGHVWMDVAGYWVQWKNNCIM